MNEKSAKKLRELVEAGDRVFSEIEWAERRGDVDRVIALRGEARSIDAAIAAVKTEAVQSDEISMLRSRAGDGENALDAYMEALKKAGRWKELARVAESEIERLMAIRSRTPDQKSRLKKVVDIHNEATDTAG